MHGPDQTPDAHLSSVLKETYRIEQLLGRGGMGAVYLATHLRLGSKVAVKLLLSGISGNPEVQHRFRREAKVAMDLSDENIVHIHDYDVTREGTPFIVMEYLEGEDLADMLRREAPLHLERAVDIARQIGSALSAAHGQGVVHRDLKPENIFLKRRANGEETVKVVDFGIAKILNSDSMVTRTGALMGTPLFMAPEQARQESTIDGRADIFSFGCILYTMLSGQLPFYGEKYAQVLLQIISRHPPPLRSMVPLLPRDVEAVVHQALAKDPAERFQSVDLMMHALSKAAGLSWGTAEEYVETVVTGEPAGLASPQRSAFGFAETIPPGAATPATMDLEPSWGQITGPREARPAMLDPGSAPTLAPPTLPPDAAPPAAQPPMAELMEMPPVTMPAAPARSRLPLLLAMTALLLCGGGVAAWLVVQRFASPVEGGAGATGPASLAEQKWADADGGAHPGALPGQQRDAAPPADAGAPAADAPIMPDTAQRTVAASGKRRGPRKPRLAILTVLVHKAGHNVDAMVFISGRRRGHSPARLRLPPGKHMVRVVRHGFAPVDRQVELRAGQRETVILKLD